MIDLNNSRRYLQIGFYIIKLHLPENKFPYFYIYISLHTEYLTRIYFFAQCCLRTILFTKRIEHCTQIEGLHFHFTVYTKHHIVCFAFYRKIVSKGKKVFDISREIKIGAQKIQRKIIRFNNSVVIFQQAIDVTIRNSVLAKLHSFHFELARAKQC